MNIKVISILIISLFVRKELDIENKLGIFVTD